MLEGVIVLLGDSVGLVVGAVEFVRREPSMLLGVGGNSAAVTVTGSASGIIVGTVVVVVVVAAGAFVGNSAVVLSVTTVLSNEGCARTIDIDGNPAARRKIIAK